MRRILFCLIALAPLPALSHVDIEKWVDKMIDKEQAASLKENVETLAHDRDAAKRLKAVEWLSNRISPPSIEALANALASDKDARVRQAAARALWQDDKKTVSAKPQLLKAQDDPDPNVVAQVAGALQAMGMKEAELVGPRKRVLASPDATPNSRFLVARNLVGFESPLTLADAMLAYLEQQAKNYTGALSDKSRGNVEMVTQALGRLVKTTKDRALIAPLVEALGRMKNAQIPLIKALAMFEPKPDNWTQMLIAQLDAPQYRVREAALYQLRFAKNEKDVAVWAPRVADMLRDREPSVRVDALWALGSAAGLASAQVEAVVAAADDPDKSVRRAAARALGEMGENAQAIPAAAKARVQGAARPALTAMEKDEDSEVRDVAKGALRKFGGGGSGEANVASVAIPAPSVPSASPGVSSGNEAAGMAVLRARKVAYEPAQFFRALMEGNLDLVRAFLDAGMSATAPQPDLGPPLRVMLFGGKGCNAKVRPTRPETIALVKLLLERGADVNGGDKNGNTPLSEAASHGCDRELMRILIKAGAKIDAKNVAGLTPFEIGLWTGSDGLEELIAAGYRMTPEKAKSFAEGYKDRPASLAMIRKATKK